MFCKFCLKIVARNQLKIAMQWLDKASSTQMNFGASDTPICKIVAAINNKQSVFVMRMNERVRH